MQILPHHPRTKRSVTPVLIALLAMPAALAQDPKLPKAEEVLDKYVEVTGGKAAYEKLRNRIVKSKMEIVGQGMELAITIYAARPNKMYVQVESEAMGNTERGISGDVVWEKSMMTGPQIKEGDERAVMLRSARFDADVNWRKIFKKVECVGLESIDGKACYKLVLTPNEGPDETRYYDKQTHLLVKSALNLTTEMGTIPLEFYTSDYREVDGIKIPFAVKQVVAGMQEMKITTESIEHDAKIAPDRFELPEEIKELQKLGEGEKKVGSEP